MNFGLSGIKFSARDVRRAENTGSTTFRFYFVSVSKDLFFYQELWKSQK